MALILILLDQFAKYFFCENQVDINIIVDLVKLQYTENNSMLFFENLNFLSIIFTSIFCIALTLYMRKKVKKKSYSEKFFLLILMGAISNLIDRIWRGYAVEFIYIKWIGTFNFADIYVIIGIIALIILVFKGKLLDEELESKSTFGSEWH